MGSRGFAEDCLKATAYGGAGAPLAGMRPGSGMLAHRHNRGRLRTYTVASPMGPLPLLRYSAIQEEGVIQSVLLLQALVGRG